MTREVLLFLMALWRRQSRLASPVIAGMVLATLADLATPVFAGHLVDAVGAGRHADAVHALLGLAALGVFMLGIRQMALWGIVRLTLRMMRDVKAEAFARIQSFSASWHAHSFSGRSSARCCRARARSTRSTT